MEMLSKVAHPILPIRVDRIHISDYSDAPGLALKTPAWARLKLSSLRRAMAQGNRKPSSEPYETCPKSASVCTTRFYNNRNDHLARFTGWHVTVKGSTIVDKEYGIFSHASIGTFESI